jgi:beta-phosphoglucomutase-like phosphatase (HAD superfamily)
MSMAISRPAVLFDIDGTLVDSNYLHVHAWQRAFADVGLPVEAWRVHRSIGMDGSKTCTPATTRPVPRC